MRKNLLMLVVYGLQLQSQQSLTLNSIRSGWLESALWNNVAGAITATMYITVRRVTNEKDWHAIDPQPWFIFKARWVGSVPELIH